MEEKIKKKKEVLRIDRSLREQKKALGNVQEMQLNKPSYSWTNDEETQVLNRWAGFWSEQPSLDKVSKSFLMPDDKGALC